MITTQNGTERAASKKRLTKRSLALSLHAAGRSVEEIARALECSVEYAAACITPPKRCDCGRIIAREDTQCRQCAEIAGLEVARRESVVRYTSLREDRDGWKKAATKMAAEFSKTIRALAFCVGFAVLGWALFLWKVLAR